ncbi:MAG: diguanylate cyclase, partial [Solirubrobacteraceae bacterium]
MDDRAHQASTPTRARWSGETDETDRLLGLYRSLAESAADVVSLRDRDNVYQYVSPSSHALFGYRPEEHIGRPASEFLHPDDRGRANAAHDRLLAGEDVVQFDYRVLRRDGSHVWVRTTAQAMRDPATGELAEVRTSTSDISEQRAREAELHEATAALQRRLRETAAIAELGARALEEPQLERFLAGACQQVAEVLGVPLCAVLIHDGESDGLCLAAGTGWRPGTIGRTLTPGAPPDWMLGSGQPSVVHTKLPDDLPWQRLVREHGALSSMWVTLADRTRPFGVLTVHTRVRTLFTSHDQTVMIAVANVLREAITRHHAEEAARYDALHDALTGLPNRRLFTARLEEALVRAADGRRRHAVLFLDIDHFKLINDSLGHHTGDRLLRLIGPQLHRAVR